MVNLLAYSLEIQPYKFPYIYIYGTTTIILPPRCEFALKISCGTTIRGRWRSLPVLLTRNNTMVNQKLIIFPDLKCGMVLWGCAPKLYPNKN